MLGPLTKSAVRGVTWFGIAQIIAQVLRLASMIILARLLAPADFGAVAAASIAADLLLRLGDFGFSEAIIQRKNVTSAHLSTSFWLGLGLGIFFCIVTVAISPVMGSFFRNEIVGPLLAVSSVTFVIAPLRFIHGSLMRRELQFFRFSIGDIGQSVAYIVATLAMAFVGLGPWSLILGGVVGQVVLCIIRWAVCPWRPSFMFKVECVKDLWGFGLNLTGSRVVQFIGESAGTFVVGRYLAATALGFYNMAGRIPSYVGSVGLMAVQRVAFPAFSVIQDEDERLRRGFKKSVKYMSLITTPVFSGLAVMGPQFVSVVLGPKWGPSTVAMQILCMVAIIQSFSLMLGPLIRARGRADIEMKIAMARVILLVPLLLVGVRFGITGVAVVILSVDIVVFLGLRSFACRLVHLSATDFLSALRPAVVSTAFTALILFGLRYMASTVLNLPDIALLIVAVLLGATIYTVSLRLIDSEAVNEMVALGREAVRPFIRRMILKKPCAEKKAPVAVHRREGNDPECETCQVFLDFWRDRRPGYVTDEELRKLEDACTPCLRRLGL